MEHHPPRSGSTSQNGSGFLRAGCYISAADQQGLLELGFSLCHEVQAGRTIWQHRRLAQRSFQSIKRDTSCSSIPSSMKSCWNCDAAP